MSRVIHKSTFEECNEYVSKIFQELKQNEEFISLENRCNDLGIEIKLSTKYTHTEEGCKITPLANMSGKIAPGIELLCKVDLVKNGEILFTKDEEGYFIEMGVTFTILKYLESLILPNYKLYDLDEILSNEIPIITLEEILDLAEENGFDSYGVLENDLVPNSVDEIFYSDEEKPDGCIKVCYDNSEYLCFSKESFSPFLFPLWSMLGFQKIQTITLTAEQIDDFIERLEGFDSRLYKSTFTDYLEDVYENCPFEISSNFEYLLNQIVICNYDVFIEMRRVLIDFLLEGKKETSSITLTL